MDKEEVIKELEAKQKYFNDLTSENEMLEKEKESIKLTIQNTLNLQTQIKNSNYNLYQQIEFTPSAEIKTENEPSIGDILKEFFRSFAKSATKAPDG